MRLIDRILTNDDPFIRKQIDPEYTPIVIIADAIAKQIDDLPDEDTSYLTPESFGNVAPPFDYFFVEATTTDGVIPNKQELQRGVLLADITEATLNGDINTYSDGHVPEGTKWVLGGTTFTWVSTFNQLLFYPLSFYVHIDEYGFVLDDPMNIPMMTLESIRLPKEISLEALKDFVMNPFNFVFKAINALHQKGEVLHYIPPKNVRKRHIRKHNVEPSEYYTLKIKPNKPQKLIDVAQVEPVKGSKKGLHIVRGHFRTVEGHPFIPNGIYYIKSHQRGTNTARQIKKDYKIDLD